MNYSTYGKTTTVEYYTDFWFCISFYHTAREDISKYDVYLPFFVIKDKASLKI